MRAVQTKPRPNKALHPTAYSLRFGRKLPSLRLPAAGELDRWAAARGVSGNITFMKKNFASYLPDFAIGLLAAAFGLFIYFHVKGTWLGGWMRLFGDPPVSNPSYKSLSPYFFTAPYAVSGTVVGLLSGCGRFRLYPLIIRCISGPVAVGVLLIVMSDANWGSSVFLPLAIKFFCVSAIASAVYGFMVSSTECETPNDEAAS